MARIPEYEPPDRQITASDKGANAFEQAGRRIGPAYNEAATLQRQAGEAQAATIRQRRWPFDMLELERSLEDTSKSTGSSKSGFGIKLEGGVNNLEHEGEGTGKSSSRSRLGNDVGATSLAAGALGKLAPRLGSTGQYHNSRIDPHTGIDLNLIRPKEQETMQLVNGELVPATKKGTAAALNDDVNGARGAQAYDQAYQNGAFNSPKTAKDFQDKYGYDPNTGRMGNDDGGNKGTYTGGNTPYTPGANQSGDQPYLSGSPSYGGDPANPVTNNWSDITNELGRILDAGVSGEWNAPNYGGGLDTSTFDPY